MNLGKELAVFLKNHSCEPFKVMHALMNKNRMGGFHLVNLQITTNGRLELSRKKNKVVTNRKDIALLGKGVEGIAFVGCIDANCKKMVVIKAAKGGLKLEYSILKSVFKLCPHIPIPYMVTTCAKEEMMYQEYASGGDLLTAITKYNDVITEDHIRMIIFQILVTLMTIQKKVPSFKHNDMHLKNVLLDVSFKTSGSIKYGNFYVPNTGLRALVGDFGFAHTSTHHNPKVVSKEFARDYGIAPNSHKMYDAHLFLNALYIELSKYRKFTEALGFLTSVIPLHYLGAETQSIKNSRMRYGMNHSDFPTFTRLLFNKYFQPFHKVRTNFTNSINVNSPPKMVLPPSKPKPKTPSPNKKVKSPSPNKKVKTPSPVKKISDDCGKKAQPKTGVGAQKLTTKEMIALIKRRGHAVPKGDPSREELCAVIKEHGLVVTPNAPKPKPVPVPVPIEAMKIKNFLASQNVVVEKPKPVPAALAVTGLSNAKLWQLYQKKITEEIYDAMPKNGEYQNRMNKASSEAYKRVKNLKAQGVTAPQYYK